MVGAKAGTAAGAGGYGGDRLASDRALRQSIPLPCRGLADGDSPSFIADRR
jgi:hypothetical protein